jgi:probable rRNA maturation factor
MNEAFALLHLERRRGHVRSAARAQSPRARPPAPPTVDIIVSSPLWRTQRGVRAVLRRAIREAAAMVATNCGELAIVLTDDSAIRALNRDWRGKDQPTNVLSFPARNPLRASGPTGGRADRARLCGDIVIAYETTDREARAAQVPMRHHLAHLAVHGFLHLMGHDHAADAQADAMEALEIAVLARLGMPNPYQPRDAEA